MTVYTLSWATGWSSAVPFCFSFEEGKETDWSCTEISFFCLCLIDRCWMNSKAWSVIDFCSVCLLKTRWHKLHIFEVQCFFVCFSITSLMLLTGEWAQPFICLIVTSLHRKFYTLVHKFSRFSSAIVSHSFLESPASPSCFGSKLYSAYFNSSVI